MRGWKTLVGTMALAGLLGLVVACGSDDSDDGASVTATQERPAVTADSGGGASSSTSTEPGTCGPAESGIGAIARSNQRSFASAPARVIDASKAYTARMVTSKGTIVIELASQDVPNTVNNFVFLSCSGFYDGLTFHRVVKTPNPFVAQGGDPNGNGSGGPGYRFADEFSPNWRHDTGVLSMANSGVNTNGSQFFITLAPQHHLDDKHSVFGKVTSGMDVVNAINQGDKILSVSIEEV